MPSAVDELRRILSEAGLGRLADRVWRLRLEGAGDEFIYNFVTESETYKRRFSGLVALREKGRAAGMNEAAYLQAEEAIRGSLRRAGLTGMNFDSNEYIGQIIGNEVSVDEAQSRILLAQQAAMTLPVEVRRELTERYGVRQEDVLAFYLDTDRVEQELEQQQRAAAVAAAYERFQSAPISTEVAEGLADQGVEYGAAVQAFEGLGTLGAGMTEQERLEGAFGLNRKIDLERAARNAAFGGGGGAALIQEGVSGLANTTA